MVSLVRDYFTVIMGLISFSPILAQELLEKIDSQWTGVQFQNSISNPQLESKFLEAFIVDKNEFNVYIIGGAGTAIGDINNDGLPDLFFTGNLVPDALYMNEGNFQFTEVTYESGINHNGWSSGVNMVDINQDGWLDIYICRSFSGNNKTENQRNLLYINQGDLTFVESASKYGLDDSSYSIQSAFFDYDHDGDLDCYILNNFPREVIRYKKMAHSIKLDITNAKDRLFKNNNGYFEDVSQEVGIDGEANGLGVSILDLNQDGWLDIFIANDYDSPDRMYFNQNGKTFINNINDKTSHITFYSMGCDFGDINNDGWMDFITVDMTGEDHYYNKTNMLKMDLKRFNSILSNGGHAQYMRNVLMLNQSGKWFSDIAHIAGLATTQWSWAPLFIDINNDSWEDIVISNGIIRDIKNRDYYNELSPLKNENPYLYFKSFPSNPVNNYIYKNNGDLTFSKMNDAWGFNEETFSQGMAVGDLDNDGDMDIVINNSDMKVSCYKNNTSILLSNNYLKVKLYGEKPNINGIGAIITLHHSSGKIQSKTLMPSRGYQSSVEPIVHFGLSHINHIDSMSVYWPNGQFSNYTNISANQTFNCYQNDVIDIDNQSEYNKVILKDISSTISRLPGHYENIYDDYRYESLLPHKLSEDGARFALADVDGNGYMDFYIGGSSGYAGILYYQNSEGNFFVGPSQPWSREKNSEDTDALFIDIDNDLDLDLYVASGSNEWKINSITYKDRIYINDGKGIFSRTNDILPEMLISTSCVVKSDYDLDGDMDLFIGARSIPRQYPLPASSVILENKNGKYTNITDNVAPLLNKIGMVTDAIWSDINLDGYDDLLVVGEWMTIHVFINENGTKLVDWTSKAGLNEMRGWWRRIHALDKDNDGDTDFIVGNLGLNNKFINHEDQWFGIYANDFDQNGSLDIVLAQSEEGNIFPIRGRECSMEQMPFINEEFPTFESFANATIFDIIEYESIDEIFFSEVDIFESVYLENNGDGTFKWYPLPNEAQLSPIYAIVTMDINHDGFLDIIIGGNQHAVEVETVRYDSSIGLLLLGSSNHLFKPIPLSTSGLMTPGEVRDIQMYSFKDKKRIIVSNNNDKIQILHVN